MAVQLFAGEHRGREFSRSPVAERQERGAMGMALPLHSLTYKLEQALVAL